MTPFVITQSGTRVDLRGGDPLAIRIDDIAHHLARINRFAGATAISVNVAGHSVHVAQELARRRAPPEVQFWGLLHDAHEAFTGDIPTPMKRMLAIAARRDVVAGIHAGLDAAIARRFGVALSAPLLAQVDDADAAVLVAEWIKWMPGPCPQEGVAPARIALKPLTADRAEQAFLDLFHRLDVLRGPTPRHAMMQFDVHGGK